MKTLLETLGMSVEEAAVELMDYAKKEATWADLEMMICSHIELAPSDIAIINESMREADWLEGIIYDDIDDIPNAEDLKAGYDGYCCYYRVEGNIIKGYQCHKLRKLLNSGKFYETKRYIAQKLMEEEAAKQIVSFCNKMSKED